jgi:hypothetical protein
MRAMPKRETDTSVETDRQEHAGASTPRRINVAITPDMLAAIERVIDREGVTLTEAVRRLVGYGDVLYRAAREDRQSIIFRDGDGNEREVLLV